ncbi:MAG TPA: hypothetical protein VH166_08915 [Mycobacterium sp.]|nr:hypothetical protein [Mycobacterium sp.]
MPFSAAVLTVAHRARVLTSPRGVVRSPMDLDGKDASEDAVGHHRGPGGPPAVTTFDQQ